MKAKYIIWWTSNADAELIGELPGTAPEYISTEFQSRMGRSGRGRLWVDKSVPVSSIDWNGQHRNAAYCGESGGIVMLKEDYTHVKNLPGLVTDTNMDTYSEESKTAEAVICEFMHKFVNENWDRINVEKCEISDTKAEFLEKVKADAQLALWVLSEVCWWGMDQVYLKELFVNLNDDQRFHVVKIEDRHIKLSWDEQNYKIEFCEPKTKTVVYFD
jgi:hypothetical protein